MSKRLLIIGSIVVVVILGGVGGYIAFNRSEKTVSPNQESGVSLFKLPTKSDETLTNYQDSSGFSFNYPKSISIKDVTPDSGEYYTLLELSKDGQTLKISITDGNTNPYKSDKNATLIGSTTLGGVSSSQYSVNGRLISVAIDQGVLYVIDGPKDAGYWEDIQNTILTSFKFGSGGDTSVSDANTSYEEEEVQ